ncbi:MAG TPA: SMP-30/gluconolactonase/LRE family protein [Verrucomicrobiae bacterium]|nr:SMP-30/gluconolactonase/LRE family protein [Verrucomicrobiae bacterium]
MQANAELVLDARATLGECPVWDARREKLYWVDILERKLHEFDVSTGRDRAFNTGQFIGSLAIRKKGGLVLGLHHGFGFFNLRTQKIQPICEPEALRPDNRFNDGKCDPAGRFWAGSMDCDARPRQGSLFCLDTNHNVRRVLRNLSIPNGITWSQDGEIMFFIDSAFPIVWAFDYDPASGRISRRRPVIRISSREGVPDGMTIDAEGMLWVALWGGGCITQWNPKNGNLLRKIPLPVSLVSSCTFGGPGLRDLYVTSARMSLKPSALSREPLAGGIFRLQPGVSGIPDYFFGG